MKQIFVLLLVAMSATVFAQSSTAVQPVQFPASKISVDIERTITGTVTDPDGYPLPGVSVHEFDTNNGTVTDAWGRYSINVSDGAVLVFSFIGYLTTAVFVGSSSNIDVIMNPDANLAIDERRKKAQ